ncbi:ESSS subunit of NADH:ubiquinone oxidoreductase-domain-containing protein [Delphinella strobiligena]|nr:ESSS subunit of NADH:ubiquinone oxidoreductase-domain-containing protein [Delphinella strobiligena]
MQSLRSSLPRRALQLSTVPRSLVAQRSLSSTSQLRSADSHGDHYNPPGGWLFGVKPGEKYQNEGWETVFYWGFFGSMAFGIIGYCYKPDTSIQTWALEEARRRLEAEGVLPDTE